MINKPKLRLYEGFNSDRLKPNWNITARMRLKKTKTN